MIPTWAADQISWTSIIPRGENVTSRFLATSGPYRRSVKISSTGIPVFQEGRCSARSHVVSSRVFDELLRKFFAN